MAKMETTKRIISADGHIDFNWLPADVFQKYAPAGLRDRLPKVTETPQGKKWMLGDRVVSPVGGAPSDSFGRKGFSRRIDMIAATGFYDDGIYHPTEIKQRAKDQERDGVHAEVIYGLLGLRNAVGDPEITAAIEDAYNLWLADWRKQMPDRFQGIALIPNHDPEAAALAVKQAAKIGLCGVDFNTGSASKPVWHPAWDPVWATAQDTNLPVHFHTSGSGYHGTATEEDRKKYAKLFLAVFHVPFQTEAAETLAAVLFSGMCERFPRFRFVLGESGVGWIPYILEQLDEWHFDRFSDLIPQKPSVYWRRQGFTTYKQETTGFRLLDMVGEDNVMWGSDYPHLDSVWLESDKYIQRDLGHLPEKSRRKIIHDTAAKLYNLN